MTLAYFDSCAFVKLVTDEEGAELAAEVWDSCDLVVSSRLAVPEVRAALASAFRRGDLIRSGLERAVDQWSAYWYAVRPVELSTEVASAAGALAERHSLRGADAVHLASALALGDPSLILATWDQRLATAALAAGLSVVPAPAA